MSGEAATFTPLPPEETRRRWRDWHRRFALALGRQCGVSEGETASLPTLNVDERLVQAIWSDQMVRTNELMTASGKAVEIIEPGRWNTSRGPDFLDARVRLAGEVLQGDIEIHTDSADWHHHGHHQDFEYNRVVLHAVLHAHDDRPYEEKQNGERLERLVLENFLQPDLETIRSTINLSDYPYGRPAHLGICHEQFMSLPADELTEFLVLAGRARMEDKIARFEAQRGSASFLQVMFQALMTAQGFKAAKTLYFLLSKRAPIQEMMDYARDFPDHRRDEVYFSAFMHVAQLFPGQPDFLEEADEETRDFLQRLEEVWRPLRPYLSDRLIPPTKRWKAGMRPASFPERRLAAMAVLLGRLTRKEDNLFRNFLDSLRATKLSTLKPRDRKKHWKNLVQSFTVEGKEHYFGNRFTFGGKKQRPQALLGEPAARSLVFNVFLPMTILYAREKEDSLLEERAWEMILQFPALEKNSVVRFMTRRLFGEESPKDGLVKMEFFQQAMLKVFSDCCAQNERTCNDCTFLALAERIKDKE